MLVVGRGPSELGEWGTEEQATLSTGGALLPCLAGLSLHYLDQGRQARQPLLGGWDFVYASLCLGENRVRHRIM